MHIKSVRFQIITASLIAVASTLGMAASASVSLVPTRLNVEGRLTQPNGAAAPDTATQQLTLSLYDAASAGNLLWSQSITNVAVTKGAFSATMDLSSGFTGSNTLDSVVAANPYLEIKAGADPPMSPRIALATSPFAFRARTAESAISVADGSTNIATGDSQSVVFKANNAEAMRIQGSGIVGIGTNSPDPACGLSVVGGDGPNGAYSALQGTTTSSYANSFGVHGTSTNGIGVIGTSQYSYGLQGTGSIGVGGFGDPAVYGDGGASGKGIDGYSNNGIGVNGYSNGGNGVVGQSANGTGVYGYCSNGTGIYGQTGSASAYAVYANGKAGGTTGWANVSDARYKTNVATFSNALNTVLGLRGVTFDWKKQEFPGMNFAGGKQVGFVAQEVEKVLPELVSTDDHGYESVTYANVVPVLVEAVKTLKRDNDAVRRQNVELRAKLDALARVVSKLQDRRK